MSEEDRRKQIMTLFGAGWTRIRIAQHFDLPYITVKQVVKRCMESSTTARKKGSGRPRRLTAEAIAIIISAVGENSQVSAPRLAGMIADKLGIRVSAGTIRNALKALEFDSCIAARKPLLSTVHKQRRLDKALEWSRWPFRTFKKVMYSDESRFNLHVSDGKVRVWRQRGTRLDEANCVTTVKGNGGGIMVWGCISYNGVGALALVEGNMDSIAYTQLMATHLHESASELGLDDDFIFQQDNATCHVSKYSREFFRENNVELLDWPAQSPDMNPIEHVWSYISIRLAEKDIKNKKQLWEEIREIWNTIPLSYIRSLYDSIPRRCAAVIRAKGSWTKY